MLTENANVPMPEVLDASREEIPDYVMGALRRLMVVGMQGPQELAWAVETAFMLGRANNREAHKALESPEGLQSFPRVAA